MVLFYETEDNSLMHYGVKGMRWGHRRAAKLVNKASTARASAKEWDEMAAYAKSKGKFKRAEKYSQNAAQDRADAAKYQQKANAKAEKRFAKVGKAAGTAEYYKQKGDQAYEKHDRNAKVFDKAAKKYESQGKVFKAEAARKAADALRARGNNERAHQVEIADHYLRKSDIYNKKASDFSKSTNINLGKKRVDSILKDSKSTGYKNAKANDEWRKEYNTRQTLGNNGYEVYNKIRGKH